jgi:hypothetical protein
MATHPARLPKPQPNNINHKDSRYERGTTGGQVTIDGDEDPVHDLHL